MFEPESDPKYATTQTTHGTILATKATELTAGCGRARTIGRHHDEELEVTLRVRGRL